ncbi:MAG: Gfo/Idh/MocA family oxidoreductase [Planctomycetia bacterium]|nr:Gfo/Idh/MocA family oxidoreductase [Planctomycetia bacterium]
MDLTPAEREIGKANFQGVVGSHYNANQPNRRQFMKGALAAAGTVPVGAAAYYGYKKLQGGPVKAGLIGSGDEGGVLVGEHNPEYLEFIGVADIRPFNRRRIFDGEPRGPRKGFNKIYGSRANNIKVYSNYSELLDNPEIKIVVIALPLHLHAPVAIEALNKGKHVLCEKLMAWNITQCKEMIRAAEKYDRCLSIGHQRHYSMLYAHAVEVLNAGEIGDIHHIRAFWHRNNSLPRLDKNGVQMMEDMVDHLTGKKTGKMIPMWRDGWRPEIPPDDRQELEAKVRQLGYYSLEELVRWRLYDRTGGGLMAELGSHQLDACSIFLGKVKPLAVTAIGGKYFYRDDRDAEDHVFCTFEFPGKNYWKDQPWGEVNDKDDKVIVTYSSINSNSYEPWGECVMGTKGTMIVEKEETVMLYGSGGKGAAVTTSTAGAGAPATAASSTWEAATAKGKSALGSDGPVSRGYREEMEHFAYCVKMWEDKNVKPAERPHPRCEGTVAMADAIIALTANRAMRGHAGNQFQPLRIVFQKDWYDPKSDAVPDADATVKTVS